MGEEEHTGESNPSQPQSTIIDVEVEQSNSLETDVHSLLALGVPLLKLEELYGRELARRFARTFVISDQETTKKILCVGAAVLARSPSSQKEALADPVFVDKLLASLKEDPDELLMDPLMLTALRDPVVLSTGFVVDRTTALNDLGKLRFSTCPFSRNKLRKTVYPLQILRQKAVEWRLKQLGTCLQLANMFVDAEHWEDAETVFQQAEVFMDIVGDEKYLEIARQLATLERRSPHVSPERAVQNHKRLAAVASGESRQKLLINAAEECLKEASSILSTLASKANVVMKSRTNKAMIANAKAWLSLYPWISEQENQKYWESIRMTWIQQFLQVAKLEKNESDIKRWTDNYYSFLRADRLAGRLKFHESLNDNDPPLL